MADAASIRHHRHLHRTEFQFERVNPMCLMLYLGSNSGLPPLDLPHLHVEPVGDQRSAVQQWFSTPIVQFIGGHGGCSCAFPNVMAEEPIEYFDGMVLGGGERDADLCSVHELLMQVGSLLAQEELVELYPVWDGDQGLAPKGRVLWQFPQLAADRFFFNERFFHMVCRE